MDTDNVNDDLASISYKLEQLSIDNIEKSKDNEFIQKFCLDSTVDSNHSYFIAKVSLNFYQLWSMFGELPCVYKSGKCKYEWKFRQIDGDVVFSIYDWNNPNKLLNTKKWYVGCSRNDKVLVSEFLKVLCDAIECYNKYYKLPIQDRSFSSEIPRVNEILKDIKKYLVLNREMLKKL